jgi:hypothetical protein
MVQPRARSCKGCDSQWIPRGAKSADAPLEGHQLGRRHCPPQSETYTSAKFHWEIRWLEECSMFHNVHFVSWETGKEHCTTCQIWTGGCVLLTYQAINYFIGYLVEVNLLRNNYSGKCEDSRWWEHGIIFITGFCIFIRIHLRKHLISDWNLQR